MTGIVHITIESAADLKDNSLLKMMDPYVAVKLGHQKAKTTKRQQGSSSTHPVFKETLTLPLPELKMPAAAAAAAAPTGMHGGVGTAIAAHLQQMANKYLAAAADGLHLAAAAAAAAAAAPSGAYPAAVPAPAPALPPPHYYPHPVAQQHPGGVAYPAATLMSPYGYHLPVDATAHNNKQHKQKGSSHSGGSKDSKHKGKMGDSKGEKKPAGQLEICVMAGLKRERKVRKAAEVAFTGAMFLISMMADDAGDSNSDNILDVEDEDEQEEQDKLIGKATLNLTPFISGTAPPQQQMQLPLVCKKGKHNGFVLFTLRVEAKPVVAAGTHTGAHAAPSLAPLLPPQAVHEQQQLQHYRAAAAAAAAACASPWEAQQLQQLQQHTGQVPQPHGSSSMYAYPYQPQGAQPYANMRQAY